MEHKSWRSSQDQAPYMGVSNQDRPRSIVETDDGGFVILGYAYNWILLK